MQVLAALLPTPQQTPGPFYPQRFPADSDNDLVHVSGRGSRRRGLRRSVTGRILDRNGRPLAGARVEIWQCDANGRYHHVDDDRARPAARRQFPGLSAQLVADAAGGYRFLTIRPVPYPGRTPHIHFAVSAAGRPRFVTQMYVAGDPGNERDGGAAGSARSGCPGQTDRAACAGSGDRRQGALAGRFDIVLDRVPG